MLIFLEIIKLKISIIKNDLEFNRRNNLFTKMCPNILKGKKATGSLGIKDDLVNAGATWVDEAAFSEGNLVWGRVVADIPDFCREMVKTLNK